MVAWGDGDGENHDALLRRLNREQGLTPWVETCRWSRRFWWLLELAGLLVGYLFVLLGGKT